MDEKILKDKVIEWLEDKELEYIIENNTITIILNVWDHGGVVEYIIIEFDEDGKKVKKYEYTHNIIDESGLRLESAIYSHPMNIIIRCKDTHASHKYKEIYYHKYSGHDISKEELTNNFTIYNMVIKMIEEIMKKKIVAFFDILKVIIDRYILTKK